MKPRTGAWWPALLLIGACATSLPPAERVAAPGEIISEAELAGAREIPRAANHLEMAEAAWSRAKALIEEGEGEEATLALERASVDAEMALALARLENTREQARRALREVQRLQQEMPPPPDP
ncbi:MAG: DUF4398 domain-containing protein [Myxococcota bacterium]